MKYFFKCLLFIITYGCFINYGLSQTGSLNKVSIPQIGITIPPLKVLIESAINHNAMVRYRTEEIEVKQTDLKSEKYYWTRNFGI